MSYNDLLKGRISSSNQIYFITTVANKRSPFFSNLYVARKIIGEMRKLHEDKLVQSIAWVLMPNHLHWVFELGDKLDLPTAMRLFKGRSAKIVNEILKRHGPVWQRNYFDHAIRGYEDITEITRYMVANPIRSGLVENIGDYPYWDAIWL
jgi:REP element-mobilizing transposase RayT